MRNIGFVAIYPIEHRAREVCVCYMAEKPKSCMLIFFGFLGFGCGFALAVWACDVWSLRFVLFWRVSLTSEFI